MAPARGLVSSGGINWRLGALDVSSSSLFVYHFFQRHTNPNSFSRLAPVCSNKSLGCWGRHLR